MVVRPKGICISKIFLDVVPGSPTISDIGILVWNDTAFLSRWVSTRRRATGCLNLVSSEEISHPKVTYTNTCMAAYINLSTFMPYPTLLASIQPARFNRIGENGLKVGPGDKSSIRVGTIQRLKWDNCQTENHRIVICNRFPMQEIQTFPMGRLR